MKKNILPLFAALSVLVVGCQKSDKKAVAQVMECVDAQGIIGGSKVSTSDALSKKVVLLLTRIEGGLSVCTGTPIAKDIILTAAHCVDGLDINNMYAVFRSDASCETQFKLSQEGVKVQSVAVHKAYTEKEKAKNDLALVKIQSSIPADYEISEVYDGKGELSSSTVTLIGYGITSESNHNSATILRTTTKNYKDETEFGIKDDLIFFKQYYNGICSGDSGGPVFFEVDGKLKVAGVNSVVFNPNGDKKDICHGYGVSMYVPYFKDWLTTEFNKLK